MSRVQNIERSVDGDQPLAFRPQRGSKSPERRARHEPEGIMLAQQFFGGQRRRTELSDHHAGGPIRQHHR